MWEKVCTLSKQKKYFIIASIVICLLAVIVYTLFLSSNNKGRGHNISIQINSGMTTDEIANKLRDNNIINNTLGFKILARIYNYDTEFKEGIYYFKANTNVNVVLSSLVNGPSEAVVRITIPEGFTVEDIASLLERKNLVDKEEFCEVAKNFTPYDYMKEATENPDIKYAVEGFLFPDTYDIDRSYTAKQIMQIMIDNFDHRLSSDMKNRAKEENLSIFELVTMASLVEKEAKFAEDRPIIADVFFKRLQENMLLQSDATIQYALNEHKEEFSIEDTKYDSPYNTYQHEGLTPGPISNPGLASIKAVLYPADTDYMYFVADENGKNHYSITYDEHLQAIENIYGK